MPASARRATRSMMGMASRVGPPKGSEPGPRFHTPAPKPVAPTLLFKWICLDIWLTSSRMCPLETRRLFRASLSHDRFKSRREHVMDRKRHDVGTRAPREEDRVALRDVAL